VIIRARDDFWAVDSILLPYETAHHFEGGIRLVGDDVPLVALGAAPPTSSWFAAERCQLRASYLAR